LLPAPTIGAWPWPDGEVVYNMKRTGVLPRALCLCMAAEKIEPEAKAAAARTK